MEKPGRNDPCVCGSGKKFKKCCERKMIGKKFMATKIDTQNNLNISSFFQKKITQLNAPDNTSETNSDNSKKIKVYIKKDINSQEEKVLINNISNQESINNS